MTEDTGAAVRRALAAIGQAQTERLIEAYPVPRVISKSSFWGDRHLVSGSTAAT